MGTRNKPLEGRRQIRQPSTATREPGREQASREPRPLGGFCRLDDHQQTVQALNCLPWKPKGAASPRELADRELRERISLSEGEYERAIVAMAIKTARRGGRWMPRKKPPAVAGNANAVQEVQKCQVN